MKWYQYLWNRSPGYYLFWTGFVYFWVGMYVIFINHFVDVEILQVCWISSLALPWIFPPLGRYIDLDVTWDKRMINWFGKDKKMTDDKLIPFPTDRALPEAKEIPTMPEPKVPAQTYYSLGITSENRLELKVGHSAITMNYGGICNLMDQLEVFKNQIAEYEGVDHDHQD